MNRNLYSNSARAHIQFEQVIHGNEPEAYASRATKMGEEARKKLVETEFGHVFDINGVKMFRKLKKANLEWFRKNNIVV